MPKNKEITFQKYCELVKKFVEKPVDIDDIHEMYVDFKKSFKKSNISATNHIIITFALCKPATHDNYLKRNKYL